MTAATLGALIPGFPLVAFLVLAVVWPLRRTGRAAGWLSIGAVGVSFVLSLRLAILILGSPEQVERSFTWIALASGPLVGVGILLDSVSVVMLLVVSALSFLIQLYSLGYLREEPPGSILGQVLRVSSSLRLRHARARER